MRQPQFIMYDDGSIGAYDPERDSIDESKVLSEAHAESSAPDYVKMNVTFFGSGSAVTACPVTDYKRADDVNARYWNDRSAELAWWNSVYVDFRRSTIEHDWLIVDNTEDYDEDDAMGYIAGFKWVGDRWFIVGAVTTPEDFKAEYPGYDFYLKFMLISDEEQISTVRYVA